MHLYTKISWLFHFLCTHETPAATEEKKRKDDTLRRQLNEIPTSYKSR